MYYEFLKTKCSLNIYKNSQGLINADVVAHAYRASTGEIETGGSRIQDHLWLYETLLSISKEGERTYVNLEEMRTRIILESHPF